MTDPILPDFSARDDTIRHLTYTPLRQRDGVPHQLFDDYWRDVHGPLCARLPGLGFYVQHHFDRTRQANLWPRPEGVAALETVLDGMVEIGFASTGDQQRFTDASPILFKDEQNFLGHDVAYDEEWSSFAAWVLRDEPPILTGEDGLRCIEIMQAAYISVATGEAVDLPLATDDTRPWG